MTRRFSTAFSAKVLLALIVCHGSVFASTFNSPNDGFSLELPPGWLQIPQSAIAETQQEILRRAPNAPKVRYDYGFQFGSTDQWFSYPYILVQVKRSGRIPEQELARIAQLPLGNAAAKFQERTRELVSEVEIGKPRYDPMRWKDEDV